MDLTNEKQVTLSIYYFLFHMDTKMISFFKNFRKTEFESLLGLLTEIFRSTVKRRKIISKVR